MISTDPMLPPGLLTRDACLALAERVFRHFTSEPASLQCASGAHAETQVVRGRVRAVNEGRNVLVTLRVNTAAGRTALVSTSQIDEAGIGDLIHAARVAAGQLVTPTGHSPGLGPQVYPEPPKLCFDSVHVPMSPDGRAAVVAAAQAATERAGVMGNADVRAEFTTFAVLDNAGLSAYRAGSFAECSLTARTKDGKGSGWAWSGFEDWNRVDVDGVVRRAVELCERSAKPVAIEPGRYTVILEPAAVAALLEPMLDWSARKADWGMTPYSRDPLGNNKLGLQMLDSRLQVVADPWDPDKPTGVFTIIGTPIPSKVTWFEDGVLRNLAYDRYYAREKGKFEVVDPSGVRLYGRGETTSLDDMIRSVQRGVWINRLSHVGRLHMRTGLLTGTTRDGVFLIENGKIVKAVKNFRFTESPFFVFNKLEAFGEPVRASREIVAPRMLVRDFDLSSLTDAV